MRIKSEAIKKVMQKVSAFIKKWLSFFLNPRFLLCFAIGWMITNGWSYVMFAFGTIYKISWMIVVSSAYLSFLWAPVSPEKIVTFIIAIFILKMLFPKDEKTLIVLKEELKSVKEKFRKKCDGKTK